MTACQKCGAPLPPPKSPGRERKWCSDRCRKSQYHKPCVDCGTLIDGTTPSRCDGRCTPCHNTHKRELSRQWILDSFAEWEELFGVPPTAGDWQPSLARQAGMEWKAERTEQTGRPWPSPTLVQNHFGSWNEGRRAAGFEAFEPGKYGREGEDPAVLAEAAALHRSGLSIAEVARRMNVCWVTARSRVERAGERQDVPE